MKPRVLHCRPPGARNTVVRVGQGLAAARQARSGTFTLVDRFVAERWPALVPSELPHRVVDAGEGLKTMAQAEDILRAMVAAGLDRGAELVAIGGGTVGDLGGFVGSVFMRGIDVVQVPTTLLAMADSSVGGKTAVNLPEGKNLVGTFHPPSSVLVDLDFLPSLTETAFLSGLAEALKMAIGLDRDLFVFLEQNRAAVLAREPDALAEVVTRSIAGKIAVVEEDLQEAGRRQVLNLGHTYGHALEAHSGFTMPHGLAVARGLHEALAVARRHDLIADGDRERCRALLLAYGYPEEPLPDEDLLRPFLHRDKKVRNGRLNFIAPTGIGACTILPLQL